MTSSARPYSDPLQSTNARAFHQNKPNKLHKAHSPLPQPQNKVSQKIHAPPCHPWSKKADPLQAQVTRAVQSPQTQRLQQLPPRQPTTDAAYCARSEQCRHDAYEHNYQDCNHGARTTPVSASPADASTSHADNQPPDGSNHPTYSCNHDSQNAAQSSDSAPPDVGLYHSPDRSYSTRA